MNDKGETQKYPLTRATTCIRVDRLPINVKEQTLSDKHSACTVKLRPNSPFVEARDTTAITLATHTRHTKKAPTSTQRTED
jgi:hypothetical protein